MPIRTENRARYPADWPEISWRVRQAAGHRCEWCQVKNGAWGYREGEHFHEVGRHGFPHGMRPPFDWAGHRIIQIVLTVAHLDHQPEHCDPANLRALCQRCHNRHDAKHRAAGARERQRQALSTPDLFEATDA